MSATECLHHRSSESENTARRRCSGISSSNLAFLSEQSIRENAPDVILEFTLPYSHNHIVKFGMPSFTEEPPYPALVGMIHKLSYKKFSGHQNSNLDCLSSGLSRCPQRERRSYWLIPRYISVNYSTRVSRFGYEQGCKDLTGLWVPFRLASIDVVFLASFHFLILYPLYSMALGIQRHKEIDAIMKNAFLSFLLPNCCFLFLALFFPSRGVLLFAKYHKTYFIGLFNIHYTR